MKQSKINIAFTSLTKLRDINLPIKKAREVYQLYIAMENAYNFALNEEKKYLNEFEGTVSENGDISFKSPKSCAEFKKHFEALINSDVELDANTVTLSESDLGSQTLTPGDIYNLEGFIIFE